MLAYLFCYAQRAKSICSVQIQVVLGPADNLFLTFPFGVSLKNSKDRNKQRWDFLALGEFAWVVQHFSSKLQKTSSKKQSVLTPKLTMHATPQRKAIILLTKRHLGYGVRKYNSSISIFCPNDLKTTEHSKLSKMFQSVLLERLFGNTSAIFLAGERRTNRLALWVSWHRCTSQHSDCQPWNLTNNTTAWQAQPHMHRHAKLFLLKGTN